MALDAPLPLTPFWRVGLAAAGVTAVPTMGKRCLCGKVSSLIAADFFARASANRW